METLPWKQGEELNGAIDKIMSAEHVVIKSKDAVNLYMSLLQNSVFQAMLLKFMQNNNLLKHKEIIELDEKNTEYHSAINNFFLNLADGVVRVESVKGEIKGE